MGEMKKLRNAVLQGMALGQGQQAPLQQQEEVELEATEEFPVEPVLARGPGRRSDWHYWAANWAAKNPDVPRDETFSLKMAEAYRAWKDAHPGQSYLDFRGSDVIDGRKRFTQKKGKKVAPVPAPFREATPPLAPMPFREPTPPLAPMPFREPTPPPAPFREPTPPPAPMPFREATPPPAPFREPTPSVARQTTSNKYSPPSAGPLSTPSLLQGRRETPPQEYYDLDEEEQEIPEESVEESVPEEQEELAPAEEAEAQAEAEAEAEEASPQWPQEEEQAELEIVTVGQQEYFRTSNNGLFAVVRDEEGNPEPGPWAGVLSDDGTQVLEVDQPEAP